MKRILTILTILVMLAAVPWTAAAADLEAGETIVLYTNDVHCSIDGYAGLAAYRAQLIADGHEVITVDAGDAIQGAAIGTMTEGSAVVDLMNSAGYDYAVPGNHEFDYGMDVFLSLAGSEAQFDYLSCNFVDLRTGLTVFPAWDMVTVNNEEIAIVGIATPESYMKSSPAYFQDENGNYIYGFSENKFYDVVQTSVDAAIDAGADRVIVVGHLGISGTTEGWKSTDVIANTVGIDAFIDAHAHEIIPEVFVSNEAGDLVLLSSTGCKFQYFGQMTLNSNGSEDAELINPETVTVMDPAAVDAGRQVQKKVDEYNKMVSDLESIVGISEVELTLNDPETGEWVIRTAETNMGDFVADAYRSVTGADIALVNSGGIRAEVDVGEITKKELMDVNPWNNEMCVVRASGQQILDALEFGARMYPAECGGFLQVSGLSFKLQSWRLSPVITDEKGDFMEINSDYPRRVTNVTVNGKPLDPDAEYTVAGSHYLLKEGGDGFNMFADAEVVSHENLPVDSEILIQYVQEKLGGVVSAAQYGRLRGDGRIIVKTKEEQLPGAGESSGDLPESNENIEDKTPEQGGETSPQMSDETNNLIPIYLMIISAGAAVMAGRKRI